MWRIMGRHQTAQAATARHHLPTTTDNHRLEYLEQTEHKAITRYMFTHFIDLYYSNYMYITSIPNTCYKIVSVWYILKDVTVHSGKKKIKQKCKVYLPQPGEAERVASTLRRLLGTAIGLEEEGLEWMLWREETSEVSLLAAGE